MSCRPSPTAPLGGIAAADLRHPIRRRYGRTAPCRLPHHAAFAPTGHASGSHRCDDSGRPATRRSARPASRWGPAPGAAALTRRGGPALAARFDGKFDDRGGRVQHHDNPVFGACGHGLDGLAERVCTATDQQDALDRRDVAHVLEHPRHRLLRGAAEREVERRRLAHLQGDDDGALRCRPGPLTRISVDDRTANLRQQLKESVLLCRLRLRP